MYDESQIQNKKWGNVAPVVNSEGKFRYSCFCGKLIKSKNSFLRHIQKCDKYKDVAISSGYMIKCEVCNNIYKNLKSHIITAHTDISINEYTRKYSDTLFSDYFKLESCDKIRKGRIEDGKRNRAEKEERQRKERGKSDDFVMCNICGNYFNFLTIHLKNSHNMTKKQYLNIYPNSKLYSKAFSEMATKRAGENGNWYNKAKDSGEDLSWYIKKNV